MHKSLIIVTALLGAVASTLPAVAQFATRVEGYTAGSNPAPGGYTDPSVALGEPSRVTPGQFGGPVTPFAAPYLNSQVVSIGQGGSLTVEFANPVQNNPLNPFGFDFLIFGGTSFVDFDWPNGVADGTGSTFGENSGSTRVYVGNDVNNLFLLNPSLAPVVDGLFPTDGAGNFNRPVNPALNNASFASQTLAGIRTLYNGSGGGTGFDLAWAVDAQNNPVNLASARFVRVEVLTGRSEIDAFSAVMVPEPTVFALAVAGLAGLVCCRRKRQGW